MPKDHISGNLVQNARLTPDIWSLLGPTTAMQVDIPSLLSFDRWIEERSDIKKTAMSVGVILSNDDPVEDLKDDLDFLRVVILNFPAFTDGRAYTQARLLRARFGYQGEIRATGDVLYDQIAFMHRSGIDGFYLKKERDVISWLSAIREIDFAYQPSLQSYRPDHHKDNVAFIEPQTTQQNIMPPCSL